MLLYFLEFFNVRGTQCCEKSKSRNIGAIKWQIGYLCVHNVAFQLKNPIRLLLQVVRMAVTTDGINLNFMISIKNL